MSSKTLQNTLLDSQYVRYTHANIKSDTTIMQVENHFYKMKGDVGMSVHEKERKQEDAYTKTQTHS